MKDIVAIKFHSQNVEAKNALISYFHLTVIQIPSNKVQGSVSAYVHHTQPRTDIFTFQLEDVTSHGAQADFTFQTVLYLEHWILRILRKR